MTAKLNSVKFFKLYRLIFNCGPFPIGSLAIPMYSEQRNGNWLILREKSMKFAEKWQNYLGSAKSKPNSISRSKVCWWHKSNAGNWYDWYESQCTAKYTVSEWNPPDHNVLFIVLRYNTQSWMQIIWNNQFTYMGVSKAFILSLWSPSF